MGYLGLMCSGPILAGFWPNMQMFDCFGHLISGLLSPPPELNLLMISSSINSLKANSGVGIMANWVKCLPITPTSYMDASSSPGCFTFNPATCQWPEKATEQVLDPCHSCRRPRSSSWLLVWAWPSVSCCNARRNVPADERPLSLTLF